MLYLTSFTGQGAQWARMGNRLSQIYPSFLQTIRVLDGYLHRMKDPPSWSIEGKRFTFTEILC
jgi:acyl transferase domain-containing protein